MSNFSNPFKKQPTAKEAAKGVKKELDAAKESWTENCATSIDGKRSS